MSHILEGLNHSIGGEKKKKKDARPSMPLPIVKVLLTFLLTAKVKDNLKYLVNL